MARGIRRRIRSLLQSRTDVQEAASCARALAGIIGGAPHRELADAAKISQAVLTSKVISKRGNIPWPAPIARELDVEDPAYLPPFGAHLPVSARDSVALGMVGLPGIAHVDAWGWTEVEDRPMVTTWIRIDGQAHVLGKLPYTSKTLQISQSRSDDGHAIITRGEHSSFLLEVFVWPSKYEGSSVWVMVSRIRAKREIQAELALSIQPMNRAGAQPIFQLQRDDKGNWSADGKPILSVSQSGRSILTSTWKENALWNMFSSGDRAKRVERLSVHCGAGNASAAEVYSASLSSGQALSTFSILPMKPVTSLRRLNELSLWKGSIADRKGLLDAGSQIDIGSGQPILEAARHRLLIDRGPLSLSRCLGVVALARMGFVKVAAERLGTWLQKGEWNQTESAFLGWAATEFLIWTQERSWLKTHGKALKKLLDELVEQESVPSGHEIFGQDGSKRWSEIWKTAALLNAVHAMGRDETDRHRWGLAGAQARSDLLLILGQAPWSASSDRAADGSSAALLAAGWLGLVPLEDEAFQRTLTFVSSRTHLEGVLLQGGAHLAATAILFAIKQRLSPHFPAVRKMAELASPTGALPKVVHRERGALESGDDPMSAALFLLLALDNIVIVDHKIMIGTSIVRLKNMPTPFGRIDVENKKGMGRWNQQSVPILFLS